MAVKQLVLDGIGDVRFQKRRNTRSVRIHIQGHKVQVTMPYWVSYGEAIKFVNSRAEWIHKNRIEKSTLADGALIGKKYQLSVVHSDITRPRTRILPQVIKITLPNGADVADEKTQAIIEKACERALAKEAEELLTPRINDLAFEHNFAFKSLHFKKLKRRWGSCDSQKHIILNIFLTQLPWEHIDYVLLHELTHTEHLHHGPEFWKKLTECAPNSQIIRKKLHDFHPQLLPY